MLKNIGNVEDKKEILKKIFSQRDVPFEQYLDDNDELLEDTDRYGLTKIEGQKVEFSRGLPIQIVIDSHIYNLSIKPAWYCNDININLYEYLIEEYRKGNEVSFRLTKDMLLNQLIIQYENYNCLKVDVSDLKNCIEDFKSISYNPQNHDKFIASVDINKKFLNIYEFKNESEIYVAKYIHAIYDEDNNILTHMDYSLNMYNKEQYKSIINNPHEKILKCHKHKKIWMLNGKIDIDTFYNILFSMYNSNQEYIKELFKR